MINFKPKKDKSLEIKNVNSLEKITNVLFSNKRKMINKKIKKLFDTKDLKNIKRLDLSLRPSDISPDLYYHLAKTLEKSR